MLLPTSLAAGVDELQWREALQRAGGADNPDHLWPVLAQGFKDLLGRYEDGSGRRWHAG